MAHDPSSSLFTGAPAAAGSRVPRRRLPAWRRAVRLLGRQLFHRAENNDDPRLAHNGERWLLGELLRAHARAAGGGPFVAVDGGANRGDYTREILRAAREAGASASVHAFEPSPVCVEVLQQAFAGDPAVRVTGAALGDAAGRAVLHQGASGSSQASLVQRDLPGAVAADIAVPLVSLGDYLRAQRIARVQLLKLDIEGSELSALRGLGEMLHPGAVEVIQFEYGGAALDAGITLRDFYRLLAPRGYVLAKLFPGFLEERGYQPWMEHYAYANYVALAPSGSPGTPT